MINKGINNVETGVPDVNLIVRLGCMMLAISAFNAVISIINSYCTSKTAAGYSMLLRKEIFAKVQKLAQSDIDKFGVASLITRSSNDIIQVQNMILTAISMIISVPIMLVGGVVMAVSLNPKLSKLILVIVPILGLLLLFLFVKIMPLFTKMQKKTDALNQVVREKLGGTRVIRVFNRSEYEDERFKVANIELTSIALKVQRIFACMMPIAIFLAFLIVGFLLAYTGITANSYDITDPVQKAALANTVGDMQAFITYFSLVIMAITLAASVFFTLPKAQISAKRIRAVLDLESDVKEAEVTLPIDESKRGVVEFRNVSFKYPEIPKEEKKKKRKDKDKEKSSAGKVSRFGKKSAPVVTADGPQINVDNLTTDISEKKEDIKNVSFTCHPGEVTAIIGGTGSGKSTLINLLPRMFDVNEGEILIGGVNIKELSFEDLHSSIAFIPQKAFLFSGTVEDNMRFGKPDATDEEIDRALEIAQAKVFVNKMPEGKNSLISQSATNISGGQKQRLSIARAIVKDADICIFDDSFSALDLATDAKLRAAIRKHMTHTNIIIVAQRVGTVLDADRIVVLEKGELVGIGKHKELMESCETYREIVASQLSEEEVAAI